MGLLMHQVKQLEYRDYQIVITEADKDNDAEYGFGFEIYQIDQDINLVRRYSVFELY